MIVLGMIKVSSLLPRETGLFVLKPKVRRDKAPRRCHQGGFTGRKGLCVQISATIAPLLADGFHLKDRDRRIGVICDPSAGFTVAFGTPIALSFFPMTLSLGMDELTGFLRGEPSFRPFPLLKVITTSVTLQKLSPFVHHGGGRGEGRTGHGGVGHYPFGRGIRPCGGFSQRTSASGLHAQGSTRDLGVLRPILPVGKTHPV